jgi:hypothetical protein
MIDRDRCGGASIQEPEVKFLDSLSLTNLGNRWAFTKQLFFMMRRRPRANSTKIANN